MNTTQTKTTLYIGAKDKDTKTQIHTLKKQRDIVASIIFDHVDGATIYTGDGIYKHDNGDKIQEKSTIVILYDVAQYDIIKICDKIKTALNQESIAVEFSQVNFNFL